MFRFDADRVRYRLRRQNACGKPLAQPCRFLTGTASRRFWQIGPF
jgi:hypothetical protein